MTFLDSHVNVGIVGGLENIGLTKRLPFGTALRMSLQGRDFRLTAERAYQLGLVDELVAPGEAMAEARKIARFGRSQLTAGGDADPTGTLEFARNGIRSLAE